MCVRFFRHDFGESGTEGLISPHPNMMSNFMICCLVYINMHNIMYYISDATNLQFWYDVREEDKFSDWFKLAKVMWIWNWQILGFFPVKLKLPHPTPKLYDEERGWLLCWVPDDIWYLISIIHAHTRPQNKQTHKK